MGLTKQERLDRMYRSVYTVCGPLDAVAFPTEEPVPFRVKDEGTEGTPLRPGDRWGRNGSCAWIRLEGTAPEAEPGQEAAILLDVGGEACLFDGSGTPLKGFTNVQSEFTVALGKPAKRVWFFPPAWEGKKLTLWADAGANDLFGCKPENGLFIRADFALFDRRRRSLYYDLETLAYYSDVLGTPEAQAVFLKAEELWDSDAGECEKIVRAFLSGRPEETDGNAVTALGHAHLDLAWLWPIRETKRKAARTLSTVVSHMARYPEYRFCVSQPQMLAWVKDEYPSLYGEVRRLHGEKRLETVGGSWVEMDTNLPDGESLVRQMTFGQRFWEKEFGVRPEILWLPDTFGYSAQLPQLMKQAGMPYFLTTKLSWNSVNKFPYSSFWWKGLDGTKVLTHLPPEGNYNSAARPDSVRKAEASPCSVLLFGIGDGGGGPGMEHLERLSREKDLPGMPSVRQEFAETFFKRLESAGETLPTWEGELYLEKHQGTYTTQSENKRNNRLCERELHALEFLGAAASCLCPGYEWRSGDVGKIWEKVLLYQFHDILPGSAIDRVYAETDESYAELLESIGRLKEEALEALRKAPGTKPVPSLMNPAPSENGDPVPENGFLRPAAPALPYCFTEFRPLRENGRSTLRSESDVLENDRLLVRFSEKGTLLSVFDKRRREETLSGESNRLLVYPDLCDGWEVPDALESPAQEELTPVSCACGLAGETAFRVYEYKYRDSAVRQTVRLSAGSARIEWETEIDWKEQHTLLRAEFSPAVAAESAVCGVPFGELPRPTMHRDSWEAAKREVCFQGYCDLSDGVRGCAVLSDCRYGIDVRDCRLSLALLRTPTFPAAHADLGRHLLAYAFLPHAGGTDEVRPESFRMRAPSVPLAFLPPLTEPFARAEGLLVSAIKPAEDGDGIVVRFYNPTGRAGKTAIRFAPSLGIVSCFSANLLEEPVAELPPGRELNFGPFEIITVRGKRKKEK